MHCNYHRAAPVEQRDRTVLRSNKSPFTRLVIRMQYVSGSTTFQRDGRSLIPDPGAWSVRLLEIMSRRNYHDCDSLYRYTYLRDIKPMPGLLLVTVFVFLFFFVFADIIKNTVKCYADGMVYNGYPCRNSDICVPLGWLCDNQRDCPGKNLFETHSIGIICNVFIYFERLISFNCYRRR